LNKHARKQLKNSTVDWISVYPKDKDLVWQVLEPGETKRKTMNSMPFKQTGYLELQKS
jgi:chlorite dismutase